MKWLFFLCLVVTLVGCSSKEEPKMTPWGTVMGEEPSENDTTSTFTLNDIIDNGEMWQEILEILLDKVSKGVEIRLIYDGMGSQFFLPFSEFLVSSIQNAEKPLPVVTGCPLLSVIIEAIPENSEKAS